MTETLFAQITTPPSVPTATAGGGVIGFGNYGWGAFTYSGQQGDIQPVRFANSILFPRQPGADGFRLFQPAGMHGTFQKALRPQLGLNISADGSVSNIATGAMNFILGNPTVNTWVGAAIHDWQVSLPNWVQQTVQNIEANFPQATNTAGLPSPNSLYGWLVILQMANEIAQTTIALNSAQDAKTDTLSEGGNYKTVTDGVIRSARVQMTKVPGTSDTKFGSTGAFYFGWLAFEYNGFYGAPHYLNGSDCSFFPEGANVTGVYVFLKPGCVATLTLPFNDYQLQSISGDLGEINALAGIFPSSLYTKVPAP